MHGFRDSNKGQTIRFALTFFVANSLHLRCPNLRGLAMQLLKYSLSPSQKHPKEPEHLSGLGCMWASVCLLYFSNAQEEARLCSKNTTAIQSYNNALVSPDGFTIWFSLLQDNFWYDRQFKLNTISRETGVVRHSGFKCHARYYRAHWDLDFNMLYFAPHDTAVFTEAAY